MADTTFIAKITRITADWLNDVNNIVYGQKTGQAPVWQTVPFITWESGQTVSLDLTDYVVSPDGSALTFTQTGGSLPSGLTLSTSGVISGTISDTQGGTYEPVVAATNDSGTTTQVLPTITVTLPFTAPTWKVSPDNVPDFNLQQVGEAFNLDLNDYILDDGDPTKVATLTFSYTSDNGFPAGLDFGTDGVITGTTTTEQTITRITIDVSNEQELNSSESFLITVSAIAAASETPEIFGWYSGNLACDATVVPSWLAPDNFFVSEGQTGVSIDMLGLYLASDGGATVTEVLIDSGSIPASLSLQETAGGAGIGFITGTIDASTSGVYNFALTAENSAGVSDASSNFSMTVTDTSVVTPTLDSIFAIKGTNVVQFNFSEAIGTTTDYVSGVSITVNTSPRNIVSVTGTETDTFLYTIDGAALAEFNTIRVVYVDLDGGLAAPPV